MKNILAVAFVVSVASIALSQVAPPARNADTVRAINAGLAPDPAALPARAAVAAVPVTTQKWEYKVSDRGGFNAGDWQKKLNDLAKEGWELDAIDEGHYILRRSVVGARGPRGGFRLEGTGIDPAVIEALKD